MNADYFRGVLKRCPTPRGLNNISHGGNNFGARFGDHATKIWENSFWDTNIGVGEVKNGPHFKMTGGRFTSFAWLASQGPRVLIREN